MDKQLSEQALGLVDMAFDIDLQLGAKLAGTVVAGLQSKAIAKVESFGLSSLPEIYLLTLTKSKAAISGLLKALEDENSGVRWRSKERILKIIS